MNPYPDTALVYNTFEGGINGATPTSGNSGGSSGIAFNQVQVTGTASAVYTTTSPLRDATSLAITGDSSGYANVRWTSANVGTLAVSCGAVHASFANFASINTFFIAYSDDTDTGFAFRLKTTTSGALRLSNGANTVTVADTTASMTAGQTYRIEWQINHGTGAYVIEFFDPNGTTALGRAEGTAAGLGSQTQQVRLGVLTLGTWSARFDDVAIGNQKIGAGSPPLDPGENPYAAAIAYNTAEGGSDGVIVTAGNSGGDSGTAFNTVQRTGTTGLTFSTSNVIHNNVSYRITGDGSGYANLRWNSTTLGTLANSCGAVYARFDTLGSSITFLIALSDDSETFAYRLKVTAGGALQLANSANGTIATSGATMTAGQLYRIEWQINHSTGAYAAQFYNADSVTATGSVSGTASGAFGPQTQQVRLGVLTLSTWSATFDSFAIHSSKIGARDNIAQSPTVSAGADQVVSSYDVVTLQATASDPNPGDSVTVAWTQTAGSPTVSLQGSGDTVTFVAPAERAGTIVTFTATASDGTLSSQDSVAIQVYPHSEFAVIGGEEVPLRSYGA
jgi:hypothetical protein